jgi:hypothetical protein
MLTIVDVNLARECEICGRENLTPEELARFEKAGLTVY